MQGAAPTPGKFVFSRTLNELKKVSVATHIRIFLHIKLGQGRLIIMKLAKKKYKKMDECPKALLNCPELKIYPKF